MRMPRGIARKGRRYYMRHYHEGRESWIALGTSDPDEAVAEFYRRKQEMVVEGHAKSNPRTPDAATFREVADRWFRERVEAEMEERNAQMIRSRLDRCLLPFLGSRPMHSLRRADCHAYKAYLRQVRPDLKAGTLHHYLRDLREVLNWAEEVEILDVAPWPKRRLLPRIERVPPRRFTEAEVAVLTALPGDHGFVVRFLLATGLRWSEACRATRRDIEGGQLTVRRTKTGIPRSVPVPRWLLEEIMRRGKTRLCPFGERSSGKFAQTVHGLTKAPDRPKGIRFNAHACRHTFATRYLEHGGPTRAAASLGARVVGDDPALRPAWRAAHPGRRGPRLRAMERSRRGPRSQGQWLLNREEIREVGLRNCYHARE